MSCKTLIQCFLWFLYLHKMQTYRCNIQGDLDCGSSPVVRYPIYLMLLPQALPWRCHVIDWLAITCYQCNSHNDSRCSMEKLPDELRLPCQPKDTMCRKISQVVEFEMNGMPPDSRIIRGCGWDETSYKGRCYQRSGFGGRQEVCSCLEDGCNSASVPVAATALMLLTFALLRF